MMVSCEASAGIVDLTPVRVVFFRLLFRGRSRVTGLILSPGTRNAIRGNVTCDRRLLQELEFHQKFNHG